MEEVPKKNQKNILAIVSYFGVFCLVPILMEEKDKFVKFHARQGLVLFIAEIATQIINRIPIFGWFTGSIAWGLWGILSLIGVINVLNNKQIPLPIIGTFAKNFKF